MMKRGISMVLSLMMLVALMVVPTKAVNQSEETKAAEMLYDLGLFRGTGTNPDGTPIFSLERVPTRNQAIIMLVRLLGKEQEALAGTWDLPFTDVPKTSSAYPYIGYAYANGLTSGTSATTYSGGDPVRSYHYLTFVLRALGYTSGEDFRVSRAWELTDQLGLTNGQYHADNATAFLRGDIASISVAALATQQKESTKTLAEKLVEDQVLTEESVQNAGLFSSAVHVPYDQKTGTIQMSDIRAAFPNAVTASVAQWDSNNAHARYLEMDYSPRSILINSSSSIRHYITGVLDTLPALTNLEGKLTISTGARSCNRIEVLDKDYHLVGYALIAPGETPENTIEFVALHYDGTEAIEQARQTIDDIYTSASRFDGSALSRETITVYNGNVKKTSSYLRVDASQLPDSAKAFQYYYIYKYGSRSYYGGATATEEERVKAAIKEITFSHEASSSDYLQQILRGKDMPINGTFNADAVVLLADADRRIVGYTMISIDELQIINTVEGDVPAPSAKQ